MDNSSRIRCNSRGGHELSTLQHFDYYKKIDVVNHMQDLAGHVNSHPD